MKLGAWVVMLTVMITIMSFLGINTAVSPLINNIGINITDGNLINADLESSPLWVKLFSEDAIEIFGVTLDGGILLILLGSTVIVGFLAKGYDTSLVLLPIVIFTAITFMSSFWSIISYVSDLGEWWMTAITTILFGGLMVGFIYACLDYYGGR